MWVFDFLWHEVVIYCHQWLSKILWRLCSGKPCTKGREGGRNGAKSASVQYFNSRMYHRNLLQKIVHCSEPWCPRDQLHSKCGSIWRVSVSICFEAPTGPTRQAPSVFFPQMAEVMDATLRWTRSRGELDHEQEEGYLGFIRAFQ